MNGYEIRLEILKMAQEIADREFMAEREPLLTDYYNKLEKIKENPDYHNVILPKLPDYPSREYIINLAETLSDFVTNKK